MYRSLFVLLTLVTALFLISGCAPKRTFAGDWAGVVSIKNPMNGQDIQIHITIHVKQADDGKYSATLDSAEQKAAGIKLDSFTVTNDDVTAALNVGTTHASYTGKSNPEATKITGTWSQSGITIPLELTKQAEPSK